MKSQQWCNCCTWLIIGSGHRREGSMSLRFLRLPKGVRPCLTPRPTVPNVHFRGIRMEHKMDDQLFIWTSNFSSHWTYQVGVQDYLLWCPARLASWSCSVYGIYQQPSNHCEHSHWNLCWWYYPSLWAQQTPFASNISSSTGGDRLHRRVGWIWARQMWSCKDEDLVDQQRYHAKSPSTKIDGSLVKFRRRLSNRHGRPRRMLTMDIRRTPIGLWARLRDSHKSGPQSG